MGLLRDYEPSDAMQLFESLLPSSRPVCEAGDVLQEYVSHPINAYMLMKRTTVIWQAARPDIMDTSSEQLWAEIQRDLAAFQQHKQEL